MSRRYPSRPSQIRRRRRMDCASCIPLKPTDTPWKYLPRLARREMNGSWPSIKLRLISLRIRYIFLPLLAVLNYLIWNKFITNSADRRTSKRNARNWANSSREHKDSWERQRRNSANWLQPLRRRRNYSIAMNRPSIGLNKTFSPSRTAFKPSLLITGLCMPKFGMF